MAGAAPDILAGVRNAVRSPIGRAARGGLSGATVVCRAGIPLRAAGASTQYRQLVADRDRLGELAAARVEQAPVARADSKVRRGLLRRYGRPRRNGSAYRQRSRVD